MYQTKVPCCDYHYGRGSREIKLYRGPVYNQVGTGFFGDLFRKLVPIFTNKVLPYVGKQLMQTGESVASDLKQGTSFGAALKKGAKSTLQRGKDDILRKLSGGGAYKRRKKAHKVSIRKQDIFLAKRK
jgi:hypothetical protein